MTNVICAIAKNEQLYIKDWCDWHLNLGFDHIYIYDNSDSPDNCLHYDNDNVTFIPIYGKKEEMLQIKCYDEFYHSHKFDWCAFIDLDEYIILEKWNNISSFINEFNDYNVIRLNWRMYGDDDLIERNVLTPIYDSITHRLDSHRYELHGKEIVKGNLDNVNICSCHYCKINGVLPKQIMPDHKETKGTVGDLHKCNEAYINHYMTKTLSEFINQKIGRGDACFSTTKIDMSYFWNVNRKTEEKLRYLKEALGDENIKK